MEQFDILRAYSILPRAGGWLDQPEYFRENTVLLMNLYAEESDDVTTDDERRTPRRRKPPKSPEIADAPQPRSKTMERLFGRPKKGGS